LAIHSLSVIEPPTISKGGLNGMEKQERRGEAETRVGMKLAVMHCTNSDALGECRAESEMHVACSLETLLALSVACTKHCLHSTLPALNVARTKHYLHSTLLTLNVTPNTIRAQCYFSVRTHLPCSAPGNENQVRNLVLLANFF